jgi:hypothetical protein
MSALVTVPLVRACTAAAALLEQVGEPDDVAVHITRDPGRAPVVEVEVRQATRGRMVAIVDAIGAALGERGWVEPTRLGERRSYAVRGTYQGEIPVWAHGAIYEDSAVTR